MLAPRLFPLYRPDGRSQDSFFKSCCLGIVWAVLIDDKVRLVTATLSANDVCFLAHPASLP